MNVAILDPRAEETRRRLVAAGLELFRRQGYEAVTTRQLAEAAGVNQSAIPYHFGGKQGVYLAVAEHVVALNASLVGPILAAAKARAGDGSAEAAAEALHQATVAMARIALDSGYRDVWMIFMAREQFHPSAAFERIYEEISAPLHGLAAELIGRVLGQPAEDAETILMAHAYLGQILGFVAARGSLERWLESTGNVRIHEVEAAVAAIGRLSRMTIAGMMVERRGLTGA